MEEYTNPFGPYPDFLKQVFVERLLEEIENEAFWKLFKTSANKNPVLCDVEDAESGKKIGTCHDPRCRCKLCPFFDSEKMTDLRKRKLSPFHYFGLNPSEAYLDVETRKHLWFCQCYKCQKRTVNKIMKQGKDSASATLMKSELNRADICEYGPSYDPSNFNVNSWKAGIVNWCVDAIERRKKF